ncbi:hypothetical protein [Kutzneria kofuensis]|uniref:Uncharacterized protein n=1 Tax=Kutzneria kofuensis TaxID=103725 RepID=A0A7W9KPQ9_9PSEU|nr:hypothetical protein [Kutzneria kofuensis]MBB5896474.1 hypothetical protein [Kutzneria kofuensis]
MADTVAALRAVFAAPAELLAGLNSSANPVAVLPVLYHLLWQRELNTDLRRPLHPDVNAPLGRWPAPHTTPARKSPEHLSPGRGPKLAVRS